MSNDTPTPSSDASTEASEHGETTSPIDYRNYGPLYAGWARALSLMMACVLSVLLCALPSVVATVVGEIDHGTLSLCMWGISAGFIHGVGYIPHTRIWRWAFSPYLAWPVMGLCVYLWVFNG